MEFVVSSVSLHNIICLRFPPVNFGVPDEVKGEVKVKRLGGEGGRLKV